MNSIKNKLIFTVVFLAASCEKKIDLIDKTVDYFFLKDRIETFCARSIIELYELKIRMKEGNITVNNFFFTPQEISKLEVHKEVIKKIYSSKENSKKQFNELLSVEQEVKKRLKNEKILPSCIKSIQEKNKCKKLEGKDSLSCINLAQRFFTIQEVTKSGITKFFPEEYMQRIYKEKIELRNYFQN